MDKMSFLPEDYLEKRIELRANMICLSLFAVVLVAIIGACFVTDQQRAEVQHQRQVISTKYQDAAKRIVQLEQLHQRKADMLRKVRITAKLIEPVPRTLILSELINHMPVHLGLLDLEMETKVTRVTLARSRTTLQQAKSGGDVADDRLDAPDPQVEVSLRLVGVAPTDIHVARFMHAISKAPLFTDVNLSFSEQVNISDLPLRKFQVEMKLNHDVDVEKIQPLQVSRIRRANPMGDRDPGWAGPISTGGRSRE